MQVILKKDAQNIGEVGDLVNVKDGYAGNYLIPNSLAEIATPGALAQRERNIARIKAKAEKLHQEALSAKEEIEKTQEIVGELQELVKEKAQELAEQLTDEDNKDKNVQEDEESSQQDKEKNTEKKGK